MKGWIKIHRQMQEHWLCKDKREFSKLEAWIDILLTVNHSDTKVLLDDQLYTVKRGQSINSQLTWAKRWNWTRSKVRRFLKLLESDSMIELKSTNKTTILTVCKYDSYQDERTSNEHQMNIKGTSDDHQVNTNKNDKNYNKYYTDNFLLSEVEGIDSSKLTAKNKLSYHILTGLVARVYKETDEKLKTKMTSEPIVDTIRKLIKIDKFSDKDIILVLAYLKFKNEFWLTQGMPSFASARKKKDGQTKFEKIHFKASLETKRDDQFYEKVKKQIQWYEIQLNK